MRRRRRRGDRFRRLRQVANVWRVAMVLALRAIAFFAAGLVMSMDAANPEMGWLDFAAALSALILAAYISWQLANGLATAPQAARRRRRVAREGERACA